MTTNPSYNFVCQMGHALAGGFLILATARLLPTHVVPVAIGLVALAAFKEFYYDFHFETPDCSGGLTGGLTDFAFYMLGIAVGLGLLLC
jgi:hypothetical protein